MTSFTSFDNNMLQSVLNDERISSFCYPSNLKDLFNHPLSELPMILDLRPEQEYRNFHLLGAVNVPLLSENSVSIEENYLSSIFNTFHAEDNNYHKIENIPSKGELFENSVVVGCNGGYPDSFRNIFLVANENQVPSAAFVNFITILKEKGFPTFYAKSHESSLNINDHDIELSPITSVRLITSLADGDFPFMWTANHGMRYASDSIYGRSIVAQERRLFGLLSQRPEVPQVINLNEKEMFFPSLVEDWGLFLGSNVNAGDLRVLRSLNVMHVINVTMECPNHFEPARTKKEQDLRERLSLAPELEASLTENPIQYKRFPVIDTPRQVMIECWEEGAEIIQQCFLERKKVLVHCAMGKSRSASLIIFYLIKYRNMSLEEAMKWVKKCRYQVSVNDGFHKQLQDYYSSKSS
jgi:rhodanese-related sulfurtransferase